MRAYWLWNVEKMLILKLQDIDFISVTNLIKFHSQTHLRKERYHVKKKTVPIAYPKRFNVLVIATPKDAFAVKSVAKPLFGKIQKSNESMKGIGSSSGSMTITPWRIYPRSQDTAALRSNRSSIIGWLKSPLIIQPLTRSNISSMTAPTFTKMDVLPFFLIPFGRRWSRPFIAPKKAMTQSFHGLKSLKNKAFIPAMSRWMENRAS